MRAGFLICIALLLTAGGAAISHSGKLSFAQPANQARALADTNSSSAKLEPTIEQAAIQVEEIVNKSNLPLRLVGTIVRPDSKISLATVRFLGVDRRENYFEDSSIDALAVVERVERERLIFRNKATGRLEYIRIGAFDPKLAATSSLIDDASSNDKELHVERKAVDHALENLAQVINDASAVPVTSPNGAIIGFRLAYIKSGSIYEKLGLKQGDVLLAVNGTTLNSPSTALDLYEQLRNSSLINLRIERNSRQIGLTYLIR